MSRGYVYILTNPSMPGLVKIGKTTRDAVGRANEIYTTGVPTPFVVAEVCSTPDCDYMEREAHEYFADARVSSGREFFRCDAPDAAQVLQDILRQQVYELLEEYMPGYVARYEPTSVDEADVMMLANLAGECSYTVAAAMAEITPDEIAPAVQRVKDKRAERSAKRQSASVVEFSPVSVAGS